MPSFLRRLRARIKYWNNAEELKKELDAHREMAAAAFAADGTSERESRWKAARLLGNTTLAREDARTVWVARWIEQLIQDVRYTLRTMRRERGFSVTASLTLALGTGVLLGVFTIFSGIFLRPWPVRAPEQVFGISTTFAEPATHGGNGAPGARVSYVAWNQIKNGMTTADLAVKFHHFSALRKAPGTRGRSGRFGLVNDGFLDTIGIGLQSGTLPADSSEPAIVISHAVWQSDFGGDPTVIGRRVWMNDHQAVITGVLEPRFLGFPPLVYDGLLILDQRTSTWLNEGLSKATDILTNPSACCVEVFGRLRPSRSLTDAADEIEARLNVAQAAFGLPDLTVQTWHTAMADRPGSVKSTVRIMFVFVFAGCVIVTLLACANIGNMQLARGLRRNRELAVRLSLGASRSRIVRQLLTESFVITLLGTIGGVIVAFAAPTLFLEFEGATSTSYTPDGAVVALAVGIAALATLLLGLAPALRVTRISLRGAAAGANAGAGRLRGLLLAAQIALSLGLIASASLLSRGAFRAAGGANAGFEFEGINVFSIGVTRIEGSASQKAARDNLRDILRAHQQLALVDDAPWRRSQPYFQVFVPGLANQIMAQNAGYNHAAISLLKLPLAAGRWPSEDSRLREAVVSRSLAMALWNTEDAIGRIFSTNHPFNGKADYSVVGVMDEVRLRDTAAGPVVVTAPQNEWLPVVLGPPSLEAELKTLVNRADPTLRVGSRPLLANLTDNMEGTFVGIAVAAGLGLVALLLASLGVFGVVAYVVEERRREIGVRLALGANRAQVRRSIVAAMRWPVIGGLAAGFGLALIGGYVLRSDLYGLSALDPLSYLAVAGLLSTAAIAATYIPMRRATRVDPAVTLRAE